MVGFASLSLSVFASLCLALSFTLDFLPCGRFLILLSPVSLSLNLLFLFVFINSIYLSIYNISFSLSLPHSFHKHAFSIRCGLSSCRFILARARVTNYHARCFHIFDFTFTWLEK